jgi:hypothetical protein
VKGVHSKGYIHKKCIPEYEADKEFKRGERLKKDALATTIANIYDFPTIQFIPHQFYPYLEDMRNDSKLFGKLGKSYKNGLPYESISYTYQYCKDRIREANRSKEFKNTLAMLKYGLAIVRNSVYDAKTFYESQKRKSESLLVQKEEHEVIEEKELKYIKKNNADMSEFLD